MMPSLIKRISGRNPESSESVNDESNELHFSLPAPYHNTWINPNTTADDKPSLSSPTKYVAPTTKRFARSTSSSTNKTWSNSPRVRYNRTPVRFVVAGEWALKECEEQTTWANGILKSAKLPLITDIRKSIGDGTTLVSLTEIVGNVRVESVNSEITCKSDRVENLDKCLEQLKSVGVDTAGIDAEDLADGNLKSTLLLVGNIRQHFDKSTTSSGNEGLHGNKAESEQHLTRDFNMPGAITLPGGSPRNSHFVNKDGVGPSSYTPRRIPYSAEDILPGTLGISKDDKMSTVKTSAPVGSLVSMTELSTNGVSQYGVEERRQQITLPTSRGQHLVRTQNTRPAVPSPKPPVTTTNAWSNEKPASQNIHKATPSIEDRLKSLINSAPSSAVDDEPPVKAAQYTDGELLHVPPPPQSRTGLDIDHRIPNNSVPYSSKQGPGFIGQNPQHGSNGNIYVPSKPTDRWQGSRAEAILDRSYDKTAYRYVPGGHDNQGFDSNDIENHDRINKPVNSVGDSELRNAWNRLYGKGTHPDQTRDPPIPSTQSPHKPYQYPAPVQNHVRFPSNPNYLEIKTNLAGRASPMGQSSNNQSQDSSSNFHNTSWNAQDSSGSLSPPINTADNKSVSQNTLTLGPAAMYPDFSNRPSRPSSARSKPAPPPKPSGENPRDITQQNSAKQTVHVDIHKNGPFAINNPNFNQSGDNQFGLRTNNKPGFNTSTDSARLLKRGLYDLDFDRGHHSQLDLQDSIFDYHGSGSEASSRSVTPPLPPLSPSNSESEESAPSVNYKLNRSASASMLTTPKTPDLVKSTTKISAEERNRKSVNVNSGSHFPSKTDKKYSSGGKTSSKLLSNGYFIKDGALSDVRESDSDLLPFDIENTILTVDSQDVESQNMHNNLASDDIDIMRQQLNNLEGMYQDLLKNLGVEKERNPSRRRWSICSSDTSSLRRPNRKVKPSAQNHQRHHYHHRDIKAINRRFQRLESHVVTLARSVAHLSSELRSHNSIVNELDGLKKEVHELKEQQFVTSQRGGGAPNFNNNMSDFDLFRGWVPSLTNPKRVHKLTKFFGQEPPLLQLFLKKLGYERYASNFEDEHIGMIELPYMTENRLESIGIPMGPRLRILQEAQLCFRQENFSIYIV